MRSRALRGVGALAALAALAPALVYAFPALVGADEAYVVLSGSMTPTFRAGDVIFVDHVGSAPLAVGDIATFRAQGGTLVTHRVVEVIDAGGAVRYRTQGDANEEADPFVVKADMVVGKYAFHLPYWGKLAAFVRTKVGYFTLVFVPCAVLILSELVKLYRLLDERDRARKAERAATQEAPR